MHAAGAFTVLAYVPHHLFTLGGPTFLKPVVPVMPATLVTMLVLPRHVSHVHACQPDASSLRMSLFSSSTNDCKPTADALVMAAMPSFHSLFSRTHGRFRRATKE